MISIRQGIKAAIVYTQNFQICTFCGEIVYIENLQIFNVEHCAEIRDPPAIDHLSPPAGHIISWTPQP